MSRHRFAQSAAVLLLLMAPVFARAASPLYTSQKELSLVGLKYLSTSNKIIIPTVYVKFLVSGDTFVAASRGGGSAKAKAKYVVEGLDKETCQSIAKAIHDDLVEKLRGAGWEVLTYADIAENPAIKAYQRLETEGDLGLPLEKNKADSDYYITASNDDGNLFKPVFQGPVWGFRDIAKAENAHIFVPTYWIAAPQVWSEKQRGYSSTRVKVNVAPGMTATHVRADFLTAKQAGGAVASASYALVAEDVGELDDSDRTPRVANGLSLALGILSGSGSIKSKSTFYAFKIKPEAYSAAALHAGTSFNQALANATKRK